MPRGTATFNAEAAKPEVSPIIFVRVLNIVNRTTPSTTYTLYLTDAPANTAWFDENDAAKTYTTCGLSFSNAEASTSNEVGSCVLRMDNVPNTFSALAQYAELNELWTQEPVWPCLYLHGRDDGCMTPAFARWAEKLGLTGHGLPDDGRPSLLDRVISVPDG